MIVLSIVLMTKILEKNRNKAFKSLFTKQAFFIIIFIKARNLYQKRKSAPDSIAAFLCVKFVISFSFIAIKT